MTALTWDAPGARFYQAGVDRAAIYLPAGVVAAWNGLISVEKTSTDQVKSYYYDGRKTFSEITPGDFMGKLKAYTYPQELDLALGQAHEQTGLVYEDQPPKPFNLCYRTKIGNDLNELGYAYRLHLIYNVMAVQDTEVYNTLADKATPTEFSWTFTATPPNVNGYPGDNGYSTGAHGAGYPQVETNFSRPTARIAVDSRTADPANLQALEDILYGTPSTNPGWPTLNSVYGLIGTTHGGGGPS